MLMLTFQTIKPIFGSFRIMEAPCNAFLTDNCWCERGKIGFPRMHMRVSEHLVTLRVGAYCTNPVNILPLFLSSDEDVVTSCIVLMIGYLSRKHHTRSNTEVLEVIYLGYEPCQNHHTSEMMPS
jgi:hypothetical protein